ncbi:sigma-70 family RNA polymerase sigma factor [Roseovarius sp. EL26]|uniref:sigma-70 family RNA polymerase sigma factor n=1 Tax=Roseovarius sp. EL26 TaxID=2126672 RepID=UPI000EA1379F|nr:sigma-70 family RNA polymerase sigma factor [Roseovarius sp. EL26]
MFTLELDISSTKQALPVALKRKQKRVSEHKTEISQQTRWMLAVRDRRDKQAFSELFDFYAPRLKAFVNRSGVSSQQAEEVVQEVMLTIWRKAYMFDPHRAQVSAWIYQIARNRQIDMMRKENRPVPEELSVEYNDEPDVGQVVALEQETGKLKQALEHLNEEQKLMIEKAYLGELTHQEISAQTGLPMGTVKSRIRLGLERLRHELKGLR